MAYEIDIGPYCDTGTAVRVIDTDAKPSWQRFGNGHKCFSVHQYVPGGSIDLQLEEHGDKSSRVTMMSLDIESTKKLIEALSVMIRMEKAV